MKNDVKLTAEQVLNYQKQANEELDRLYKEHSDLISQPKGLEKTTYPFGGSFSIGGFGYFRLFSVTPMEFTSGKKLTFMGEGGGIIIGGGIFLGAGSMNIDPSRLHNQKVEFIVGGGPGVPAPLSITWFLHGRPIGVFVGAGISAFGGSGGGVGQFTAI